MIRQDIDVKGYWHVVIIYNAYLGYYNTGFTHTDYKNKVSVVGVSLSTSCEEFMDTLIHEIRHLVNDICKYYDVDLESEDASYLTGFIIKRVYRFYKDKLNKC